MKLEHGGQVPRQQAHLLSDEGHLPLENRLIRKDVDNRDLGTLVVAEGVEREQATDSVDHPRVEAAVVLEPPVLDLPGAQIDDGLANGPYLSARCWS
jgi:hypothetical protein